jgi:uncharacterized membrane protein
MKSLYFVSCIILCLIVLSPTIALVVPLPEGQRFSQLWVLGPNQKMEDIPSKITSGINYRVFLGVGNQMGDLEYYLVRVKLRNQSDPIPDNDAGIPATLPVLFEYRVFLQNNATWQKEVTFSFDQILIEGNLSRISKLLIDGYALDVNKTSMLDEKDNVFFFEIFFELWNLNQTTSTFQFQNRYVGLWLRLDSSSQ